MVHVAPNERTNDQQTYGIYNKRCRWVSEIIHFAACPITWCQASRLVAPGDLWQPAHVLCRSARATSFGRVLLVSRRKTRTHANVHTHTHPTQHYKQCVCVCDVRTIYWNVLHSIRTRLCAHFRKCGADSMKMIATRSSIWHAGHVRVRMEEDGHIEWVMRERNMRFLCISNGCVCVCDGCNEVNCQR